MRREALTGSDSVHEGADSLAVVPVGGEVSDWHVWKLVLHPDE